MFERPKKRFIMGLAAGEITPPPEVYESAGPDLSGRIPLKYLGQDMIVFGFADARARTFCTRNRMIKWWNDEKRSN